MTYYLIEGVNPTPWQAPKLGVARSRAGHYPVSYPVDEMVVYKEAIKEYMLDKYKDIGPLIIAKPLMVTFWYWRSLNFGGQRRNRCDTSNLNKCLEDALQGVLFPNDRDNRIVIGVSVAQAKDITPRIVIRVEPCDELPQWLVPPATLTMEV